MLTKRNSLQRKKENTEMENFRNDYALTNKPPVQAAVKLNSNKINKLAADFPIAVKFCTATDMMAPSDNAPPG